jgi:hypothetical protein
MDEEAPQRTGIWRFLARPPLQPSPKTRGREYQDIGSEADGANSHQKLVKYDRVLFMPSPAIMRGRGLGEGPFTAFFTNTRATLMSARFSLTIGRV